MLHIVIWCSSDVIRWIEKGWSMPLVCFLPFLLLSVCTLQLLWYDSYKAYPVATVPHIDKDHQTAFLPWRESHHIQTEQFVRLPAVASHTIRNHKNSGALMPLIDSNEQLETSTMKTSPWTIFAHAEVGGAYTNNGKRRLTHNHR